MKTNTHMQTCQHACARVTGVPAKGAMLRACDAGRVRGGPAAAGGGRRTQLPDTARPPSGEKAQQVTVPLWPASVCVSAPVAASHSFSVASCARAHEAPPCPSAPYPSAPAPRPARPRAAAGRTAAVRVCGAHAVLCVCARARASACGACRCASSAGPYQTRRPGAEPSADAFSRGTNHSDAHCCSERSSTQSEGACE